MPTSEIDDIFASKKRKITPQASHTHVPPATKKKSKKSKERHDKDDPKGRSSSTKKSKEPATIIDPSAPKQTAVNLPASQSTKPGKKRKRLDDKDRFTDSRGTASRRKTDEGWSIYKEGELGITDNGGDTPLCPFDCQCCF